MEDSSLLSNQILQPPEIAPENSTNKLLEALNNNVNIIGFITNEDAPLENIISQGTIKPNDSG